MFHVVFDSRGAELISAAMDLDNALDGEIVLITDDYSAGPVKDLLTDAGRESRRQWWASLLDNEETTSVPFSDKDILEPILVRMHEEEFDEIWIWVAPNARDVSGYYQLISQLKEYSGRIFIIALNNLPFIGEKGNVFYPNYLSEIPAREFVKAKKLVRPVTSAEFETDPDEWLKLGLENKHLRVLEGGKKIVQKDDDYYDTLITKYLSSSAQKITRIIHQFLLKSPEKLNEAFLRWRLKQLVGSGVAEMQGENIKLYGSPAETADHSDLSENNQTPA